MKISKEEIQKARQTDLYSYLQTQNEIALQEGRTPPYLIEPEGKQYRLKDHGGLLFQKNFWNQRNTGIGGNTLDFLVKIEGKSFKEAVDLLNQRQGIELKRVEPSERIEKEKAPFVLPERNESFRRAIAYLTKTRGLDSEILLDEIKKGRIYEDKEYHNVVFVGFDRNDEPVWAQKRSTLSGKRFIADQEGSDPRHSYYYGNPDAKTVVVVESPIEALSLASLLKIQGKDISEFCFRSLGGVHDTALKQHLLDHPNCRGILTALNNDRGEKENEIKGHEASQIIEKRYKAQGYTVGSIFPKSKDWNDDLRAIQKEQQKDRLPEKENDIEKQIREYARKKQQERQKSRVMERTRTR